MDNTDTEHAHDIADHGVEIRQGLLFRQAHIAQAWRNGAISVRDQLHEQHAVQTHIRLRHAHASIRQAE